MVQCLLLSYFLFLLNFTSSLLCSCVLVVSSLSVRVFPESLRVSVCVEGGYPYWITAVTERIWLGWRCWAGIRFQRCADMSASGRFIRLEETVWTWLFRVWDWLFVPQQWGRLRRWLGLKSRHRYWIPMWLWVIPAVYSKSGIQFVLLC